MALWDNDPIVGGDNNKQNLWDNDPILQSSVPVQPNYLTPPLEQPQASFVDNPAEWLAGAFEGRGDNIALGADNVMKGADLVTADFVPEQAYSFDAKLNNAVSDLLPEGWLDKNPATSQEFIDQTIGDIKANDEQMAKNIPSNLTDWQQGLGSAVESAPITLASIGLSMINPALGLAGFTGYEGLGSYGEARSEGKGKGQSLVYGTVNGAIEGWTERLGLKPLMKVFGKTGATKQFAEYVLKEYAGESLATLGQSLNAYIHKLDKVLNNPDISLQDKIDTQLERQKITLMATTFMTAGAGSVKGTAMAVDSLAPADKKLGNEMQGAVDNTEVNQQAINQNTVDMLNPNPDAVNAGQGQPAPVQAQNESQAVDDVFDSFDKTDINAESNTDDFGNPLNTDDFGNEVPYHHNADIRSYQMNRNAGMNNVEFGGTENPAPVESTPHLKPSKLNKMKKADLDIEAKAREIDTANMTKDEIVDAIDDYQIGREVKPKLVEPKAPVIKSKTPILSWMAERGVARDSELGQTLNSQDVKRVGLYRNGKQAGYDNIPSVEFTEAFGIVPEEDGNGYVDIGWLSEQAVAESHGETTLNEDQIVEEENYQYDLQVFNEEVAKQNTDVNVLINDTQIESEQDYINAMLGNANIENQRGNNEQATERNIGQDERSSQIAGQADSISTNERGLPKADENIGRSEEQTSEVEKQAVTVDGKEIDIDAINDPAPELAIEYATQAGKPFKTKAILEKRLNRDGLTANYDIVEKDSGFVGVRRSEDTNPEVSDKDVNGAGEQTQGNWRDRYNNVTDQEEIDGQMYSSEKGDILRAIADVSKSEQELQDVVNKLESDFEIGDGKVMEVAWAVMQNPSATKDLIQRAKDLRDEVEGLSENETTADKYGQSNKEKVEPEVEKPEGAGSIGMRLKEGEATTTQTGRETTPFPKLDSSSHRKALNTSARVDKWLMENAVAEAESRGDKFNQRMFEADLPLTNKSENLPQASKDSAEQYLFGDEVVPVVKSPLRDINAKDEQQDEDPTNEFDGKINFSVKTEEKDLYVTHNLTEDNLIHADKMGGLAVPSLAVTKASTGFDSFGDISLIGNSDLVDSTKDSKAKTFNADVYSPRYPNVSYEVKIDTFNKELSSLNKIVRDKYDARGFNLNEIEEVGIRAFEDSRLAFLEDTGRGFKPITKTTKLPKEFHAFAGQDRFILKDDEKFKLAVKTYLGNKKFGGKLPTSGEHFDNLVRNYATDTELTTSLNPVADYYANKHKAEDKVSKSKKLTQEMKVWAQDKADRVIHNERIFNGWTYGGNKKFIQHNLDNVIKLMKKDLKGGENFFSGVGTLRSQVSKQFKSVAQIKKHRDSIISTEDIAELKEEVGSTYYDLIQALVPYSAYPLNDNSLMVTDNIADGLHDYAKTGRWTDFKDVPESLKQEVDDFLNKLSNAPTEYFEAKIQREVGLGEFVYAVMPKDTSKRAKEVARSNGLTVKLYDPKVEGDKKRVISGLKKVLFSVKKDNDKVDARDKGIFDDGNDKDIKILKKALVKAYGIPESEAKIGKGNLGLHGNDKREIEELFNKKIKAVRTGVALDRFHGVFVDEASDVIFVNENSDTPVIEIIGHEMLHSMKLERPDLYDHVIDVFSPMVSDFDNYKKNLNEARAEQGLGALDFKGVREEFVADLFGESWNTKEFWSHIAVENKGKFKKLVAWVKRWLAKLGNFVDSDVTSTGLDENSMLANHFVYSDEIVKAQGVMKETLREYVKWRKGDKQSGQTLKDGAIKFSANNDDIKFSAKGDVKQVDSIDAPVYKPLADIEVLNTSNKPYKTKQALVKKLREKGVEDIIEIQETDEGFVGVPKGSVVARINLFEGGDKRSQADHYLGKIADDYQAVFKQVARKATTVQSKILRAVKDKERREAITHYIEGKDVKLNSIELNVAKNVQKFLADMGKTLKDEGIIENFLENYIPHYWDVKPKQTTEFMETLLAGGGAGTAFRHGKQRTLSTYEEGIKLGYEPKTLDVAEIVKMYADSVAKTKALKSTIRRLESKTMEKVLGFPLIVKDEFRFKEEDGSTKVMKNKKASKLRDKDGYTRFEHSMLKDYYIHPDIKPVMDHIFYVNKDGGIKKFAMALNYMLKRNQVSMSLFHMTVLGQNYLLTGANPLKVKKMLAQLRNGDDGGMIDFAIASGLGVNGTEDILAQNDVFYAGMNDLSKAMSKMKFGKLADKLGIPYLGKGNVVDGYIAINKAMDKVMWDTVMTGGKLVAFSDKFMKYRMDSKYDDVSDIDLGRKIAQFLNDAQGGQDWFKLAQGIENKMMRDLATKVTAPNARKWAQIMLFAPDWTVSNIRVAGKGLTLNSRKVLNRTGNMFNIEGLKNIETDEVARKMYTSYMVRSLMYYAIMGTALQCMWGDDCHPVWENKDMARVDRGNGESMMFFKQFTEFWHWFTNPFGSFLSKTGNYPKLAMEIVSQENYINSRKFALFGEDKKTTSKDGKWEHNWKPAYEGNTIHILKKAMPIWMSAVMNAPDGKGFERFIMGNFAMPIYGTPKKEK